MTEKKFYKLGVEVIQAMPERKHFLLGKSSLSSSPTVMDHQEGKYQEILPEDINLCQSGAQSVL